MVEQNSHLSVGIEDDTASGDDWIEEISENVFYQILCEEESYEAAPEDGDTTIISSVETSENINYILPTLTDIDYSQTLDSDAMLIPGLHPGQSVEAAAMAIINFLNQPGCHWKEEVVDIMVRSSHPNQQLY